MRPAAPPRRRPMRRSASTSTPAGATNARSSQLPDAGADDRLDDPALAQLVASDLLDDPPARHHDHAITEARELEWIARLHDHRDALRRLFAQRLVDVEARADVDALRGLLSEDYPHAAAQE